MEGDETGKEAAKVLLSCSLEVWQTEGRLNSRPGETYLAIRLTGTRDVYDILGVKEHPIRKAILKAFYALLPGQVYIDTLVGGVEPIAIDPNWLTNLIEEARHVHNQAVRADNVLIWNNLRFRSRSEVQIATALDRAGVLFLPNCMARLGTLDSRRNREADFLVCYNGKWGILEVDGEPFHPPSRTAEDHERDRLFRSHGILVVEHFDATECFENPYGVVRRFLEILKQA